MKKNIEFTNSQYKMLVEMAFYMDWIQTSHKIEEELNSEDKKLKLLYNHILSQAKKFGAQQMVNKFEYGDMELGFEKENELVSKVHNYENQVFFPNLIDKLAFRDMVNKYGLVELSEMDDYERMDKLEEIAIIYEEEFKANQLDNLKIK